MVLIHIVRCWPQAAHPCQATNSTTQACSGSKLTPKHCWPVTSDSSGPSPATSLNTTPVRPSLRAVDLERANSMAAPGSSSRVLMSRMRLRRKATGRSMQVVEWEGVGGQNQKEAVILIKSGRQGKGACSTQTAAYPCGPQATYQHLPPIATSRGV